MSKNVKMTVDGEVKTYNGISTVQIPTAEGGTAEFKDVDEIKTPSGSVTITENGTHDVTNFAEAIVNVQTNGGSSNGENSYEMGSFTLNESARNYTYTHSLGRVPKFVIVYPIAVGVTEETYAISVETIINGLGQEDYDISSNSETLLSSPTPFVSYAGTGYQASVISGSYGTGAAGTTAYETVELTEKYVKVGSYNTQVSASGKLVAGTYGIIIG